MKESKIKRFIVISWQVFEWLVAHPVLKTILYTKVVLPRYEDIKTRPLLIVGNHKTVIDPWLFVQSLPFKYYWSILPIRFLATQSPRHWFLKIIYWVITYPFIYWPNGVLILPPRDKDGVLTIEDKTASTVDRLQKGEAVMIFAEGRVHKKDGIGEFKRGPQHIHYKSKAPILLTTIKIKGPWWLPWSKRTIRWDKEHTYFSEHTPLNEIESSKWLHRRAEELYNKD
ncbi:hypothetical protein CL654_02380 [bacterium]|nr:hypothetical protein [bacterium]|tara:strand:- start:15458 stop:16138 length:681 start_codon:yes stop_codon:yes gene_type:complete